MSTGILSIQDLSHRFGTNRVLHQVNLSIHKGQIVALVGPSGCGKTTLLQAIVGTHPPCQGTIQVATECGYHLVSGPGRDRGIVYQRYSLFPHLTALENVAYGLMVDQTSALDRVFRRSKWKSLRKDHLEQAAHLLQSMRLGAALNKYPPEMSGGMCQRVAIAQALIMKPSILLLDEPFGALDESTREELQRILLTIYDDNLKKKGDPSHHPVTILIVTHEINEALFVSDRVVGLSQYWNWKEEGHLSCPGATMVYDQPAPVFSPGDERNTSVFRQQKIDILHAVFDPQFLQSYREYLQVSCSQQQSG